MLKIITDTADSATILRLEGELTGGTELGLTVTRLRGEGRDRLVVDLAQVWMINSAGLGELVRLTAEANSQGGRMLYVNPSPFVQGVFDNTRLNTFFEVHRSLDSALAALKSAG